jgi:hypothetical protein
VLTGIGPVALRQPRVRDRAAAADDPGRIRFPSTILPLQSIIKGGVSLLQGNRVKDWVTSL